MTPAAARTPGTGSGPAVLRITHLVYFELTVATVGVGNARNAGLLAVRILAAGDPALQQQMLEFQARLKETAQEKGKAVRGESAHKLGF